MAFKSRKHSEKRKMFATGSEERESAKFFISSSHLASASASFAKADYLVDFDYFETNKALIYGMKMIEEDLDEIRRGVVDDNEIDINGGSF